VWVRAVGWQLASRVPDPPTRTVCRAELEAAATAAERAELTSRFSFSLSGLFGSAVMHFTRLIPGLVRPRDEVLVAPVKMHCVTNFAGIRGMSAMICASIRWQMWEAISPRPFTVC
jgi:hypothetical protein